MSARAIDVEWILDDFPILHSYHKPPSYRCRGSHAFERWLFPLSQQARLSQCLRHLPGPCHLRYLSGLCRLRQPSEATPLSRQSEFNGLIRTRSTEKVAKDNLRSRSGRTVTRVRIERTWRCTGAPRRAYEGFSYTRFGVLPERRWVQPLRFKVFRSSRNLSGYYVFHLHCNKANL